MAVAVISRGITIECADSNALRMPKNRPREVAQSSMWDASAAESVETKSPWQALEKWVLALRVVMVFSGRCELFFAAFSGALPALACTYLTVFRYYGLTLGF